MISSCFPFTTYRDNQLETLKKCVEYFESGIDVVIIEGPTGFGKSPVNIALGRYFKPSYYTTPQVKLVEQLARDFGPKELVIDGGEGYAIPLLARKRYICKVTGMDSENCNLRNNPDHKCSKEGLCTYWKQKEGVFKSEIAITTFSNLIVNQYIIPKFTMEGDQIAFTPRNLLIIDECHSLEEQIAGLHAGFKISPYSFPKIDNLQLKIWNETKGYLPHTNKSFIEIQDVLEFVDRVYDITIEYEEDSIYKERLKQDKYKQKMKSLRNHILFMKEELKEKRKWIVNIESLKSLNIKIPVFKPIRVDNFLKKFIWSYGNKILLTSATIPYRTNLKKWLNRLGLGDKSFKFISLPMSFPKNHRPIHLEKMGGSLSYKMKEQNWSNCIKNTKDILRKHKGQKGVIHCNSYSFMWDLNKELKTEFSLFLHNKQELDGEDVIKAWIESKRDILISPSVYEGVDLKDDLCRFQILFKIPYAQINDGRVDHILNKEKDWEWYNNETLIKIIQAYGRAVRHKEDYADFYIIDSSFSNLYLRVEFPEYFKEAIKNN